ncbi:MAG: methyltransferase domain-containing protein [Candidatus Methanoperedens sp.]
MRFNIFNKKPTTLSSESQKALEWIEANIIDGKGIAITSKKKVNYPEVTGYTIPTLNQWGEKDLARNLTNWLIQQQNDTGSFSAPDGTPYTFDTGQVIRGFVAALNDMPEVENPLRKACDWILTQIQRDGRLSTPSTEMWGNIADDRIHLYVLPPLIDAGKKLNEPRYIDAAHRVLIYYKQRKDLTEFNTLSHFIAYIIEALCDLGEIELARAAMKEVVSLQRKDGSIPAYKNVSWVCSTGVAQFALIWYKLGMKENADKAMHYLETIQNRSGGFYGSYGKGADYFPKEEISWAVKFFLDANHWKIKTAFDKEVNIFSDSIDEKDGRVQEILSFLGDVNDKKVIDVGCGKGRYLKILKERYPKSILYGVDISEKMLSFCPKEIETVSGSLLDIPYPDVFFDCVYSVEALEHAIMTENAIKEMVRVLKPEGNIIIIDKNKNMFGKLKLEPWEQWFNPKEIISLLQRYDVEAHYKPITYGTQTQSDGLFISWTGIKK